MIGQLLSDTCTFLKDSFWTIQNPEYPSLKVEQYILERIRTNPNTNDWSFSAKTLNLSSLRNTITDLTRDGYLTSRYDEVLNILHLSATETAKNLKLAMHESRPPETLDLTSLTARIFTVIVNHEKAQLEDALLSIQYQEDVLDEGETLIIENLSNPWAISKIFELLKKTGTLLESEVKTEDERVYTTFRRVPDPANRPPSLYERATTKCSGVWHWITSTVSGNHFDPTVIDLNTLNSDGIPQAFIDTISHETLSDPVRTACGHVFSRESITPWIENHHDCPTCRTEVRVLYEATNVRNAMLRFFNDNPQLRTA